MPYSGQHYEQESNSYAGGTDMSKQSDLDNHANQLNPNNDAYWQSREEDERPDDWEDRAGGDDRNPKGTEPPRKR